MSVAKSGLYERTRPLEVLGIGEAEEKIYTVLLNHRFATLNEISKASGLSRGKVQKAIGVLEEVGLVTHSPERPRRYIPGSPDIAMQALVMRHEEEVKRAQAEIARFQMQFNATKEPDKSEEMLEVVTSQEAQLQVFRQIFEMAEREILSLTRPPERIPRDTAPECYEAQENARKRGVRCMSVVDADELDLPGNLHHIRQDMQVGEKLRFYPKLPFKMILADHRIAVIPLNLQDPASSMLVIRTSALLDAMKALFDLIWAQSIPITSVRSEGVRFGDRSPNITEESSELITLLVAGLSDKAIAHEMDLSIRTVQRRVADLLKEFRSRTRFQAGWMAAHRILAGDNSSD